ncbi:MAG: DUF2007 domain-containing protein [Candidatus Omnitrophota bacterium]
MADLISIKTFLHRHEAELAKGLLSEKGIEAIVQADDCGGYRPHLTFGTGGVQLLVRKEDKQRAEEALRVIGGSKNE